MESHSKILGHPLHPMLIVFPLGLLATAVIFDLTGILTNDHNWVGVAFYLIGAGIIGGLLAAIFGAIDWLAIPSGTRAKKIGLWHGSANVIVTGLFAVSWFLRRDDSLNPEALAFILSLLGFGLALFSGWLGGELVYRLRVGVDDGANLDAPNSLTTSQPNRVEVQPR